MSETRVQLCSTGYSREEPAEQWFCGSKTPILTAAKRGMKDN
jgi:hypothetical protein